MNNLISGRTVQPATITPRTITPTSTLPNTIKQPSIALPTPDGSYINPFTQTPGESVNRGTQEYYNGLPVYIDSRTNRKYVLSPTNEMLFI